MVLLFVLAEAKTVSSERVLEIKEVVSNGSRYKARREVWPTGFKSDPRGDSQLKTEDSQSTSNPVSEPTGTKRCSFIWMKKWNPGDEYPTGIEGKSEQGRL